VVAYYAAPDKPGHALTTVQPYLRPEQIRLPLIYPVTGRRPEPPYDYEGQMREFYDRAAQRVAEHLDTGRDVAVISEGDPLFYGSFMYLHDRLAERYQTEVVPGVCSVAASAAVLGTPLVYRDQRFQVVAATLPEETLIEWLDGVESAAIMKLGSHFEKVRRVLRRLGLLGRARYVERATMAGERVCPIEEVDPASVPYFSMILIPGERWPGSSASAPASVPTPERQPPRPGRLAVIGLGPGAAELMAPAARQELERAQDIVGYTTYVELAGPFRPDQRLFASDNRQELTRAQLAFELAAQGRHVALVSSGDPGVFAMAAAVFEALEQSKDPAWHAVELTVLPGISAAQAAAARAGAPLGHDFCVISLSDNLKPWSLIEHRLRQAALADLVLALYNPRSKARPDQFAQALAILRGLRAPDTPVVLGRDLGRPGEALTITTLDAVQPDHVDMRTVVIVGSSLTRRLPRPDGGTWVYTPRWSGRAPLASDPEPL
jgi:precorrin-3 methyltransferase (EC 2.1.1.131)/precorrin-2 C20-methyltransferase (EC 2.1.1.130)/cobalt-factor II C20-methyltransferase (EC 2.1.1.151)